MNFKNQKLHVAEIVHGVDSEIHNICMKYIPRAHEEEVWKEMSKELSEVFARYPGNDDFICPIVLAHLDFLATFLDEKNQKERAAKTRRWLKGICGEE